MMQQSKDKPYTKHVPSLRFPEFKGEWEEKRLGEVARIKRGASPRPIADQRWFDQKSTVGWVRISDVTKSDVTLYRTTQYLSQEGIQKSRFVKKGALIMSICATLGKPIHTGFNVCIHDGFVVFEEPTIDQYFLYYMLYKFQHNWIKYGQPGIQLNLNSDIVSSDKKIIPNSSQEQHKIADFLTAVDQRIQLLERKHKLLKDYKKGVMQQIFAQKIRFKDEQGHAYSDWEEKRLGEVFKRIITKNTNNNRNVLTISAQLGLINQEEYFNKSISSENTARYYLLHKGDFAYNKSYSKGYPMGAIKKLSRYKQGVVSPLYICFRAQGINLNEYFKHYFDSGFLNKQLYKIVQEGARNHGLLNVSVVEFFHDVYLPQPSPLEQQKIADFLTAIDTKIEHTHSQLEKTKLFKKALLQQMFV